MKILDLLDGKRTRREALKTALCATGAALTAGKSVDALGESRQRRETGLPTVNVQPFKIKISQPILDDLRQRLSRTRWPDEVSGADWNYGTNLAYLKELVSYWQSKFDWRAQENAINKFAHFRAQIDGLNIHFIHERSKGKNPMPLLLLHGWPSSFLQMLKIIPLLTDPGSHGGDPADSFDVIVPSLPGYGFSDRPVEPGMSVRRIAGMFATLMTRELGYERYVVRATDQGEGTVRQMGLAQPELLIGLHLSGAFPFVTNVPTDLSEAEQRFIKDVERWRNTELGYMLLQSTKPQTVAYGLNDSPSGLAAWIIEKFRTWSDCGGDVEKRFTKDELLNTITIYWATQTINSSMRLYYENTHDREAKVERVEVPTAMAMPPRDMFSKPREWANRFYNVVRWTELPRGGHFLEMEEPELVANDMRAFFGALRRENRS
jgi:pimeloyl-ACP methyl ester carboxylesterase